MPIHAGRNYFGHYFQWGEHGKKYYFNPKVKTSERAAYLRAESQMRAAYLHGYRGGKKKDKL